MTTSGDGGTLLLSGETIGGVTKNVIYLSPMDGPFPGSLSISSYKFSFTSSVEVFPLLTFDAPLCSIQSVEKIGGASSKGDHAYGVEVVMKDIRSYRFAFKQEGHSRRVFYDALVNAAFPLSNGKNVFAYPFKASLPAGTYDTDGWKIFDMRAELERIGVPGGGWRISTVNDSYQFCSTYPSVLAVPETTGDEQLKLAGVFRSRARIPVLSWLHPVNHSSLSRGSQPLVGSLGKRNKDDEQYLADIAKANSHSQKYFIMDARPRLIAIANKALGGGYEDEENYPNAELVFLDIGNIHVVRDSLRKVRDLCCPTPQQVHWMSGLENTRWLDLQKSFIASAVYIVDKMDRCGISIVVHCSDGWDRTAQICSLAQVMMDPFYRTVRGLAVLIEKEWLAFGHKFQQRIGHGSKNAGDEQRSPIFLQFIDSVWQLTNQFPSAFEFNELLLLAILDHLYSCLFGTFLGNSEKEREVVKASTVSLWSHVDRHLQEFLNPLYASYMHPNVLYPVASVRRLRFWSAYFMRANGRSQPSDSCARMESDLHKLCDRLKVLCVDMQKEADEQQAAS